MPDRSSLRLLAGDLRLAASLLTRLPLIVDPAAVVARGAIAMWAFPLVGAGVGLLGAGLAAILMLLGVADGLAVALGLAVMVLVTGALHEDGLADTADGLGPLAAPERRLEIMRDSRIGAFGALALVLALICRHAGLAGFEPTALILAATAAAAASRAAMVWLAYLFPAARRDGMAASIGRPPREAVFGALVTSLVFCSLAAGWAGFLVATLAILAALPVARVAQRLIGGITGDILGAAQQCSEIAALAALTALV